METFQLTAKTLEGLEEVLAAEIREIGGANVQTGRRAVHFSGDTALIYRANYRLRTALRILKQIDSFRFSSIDDFYVKCMKVNWESYMNINHSFVIQSTVVQSDLFKNSMFASLKVKDALVDRFRQKTGKRPNVETIEPDIIFHVHIAQDVCTLSIDSSGESLHKRGYRMIQGDAPLSEVLAAGMILLSGWNGETDFVDPMCGSGTLPIEAAMIARNIPAGRFRKHFSFFNWKDFDSELFEKIREEDTQRPFSKKIVASDISAKNIMGAQTNARKARVFNLIEFHTQDFKNLDLSLNNACLMMNPPYGERLQPKELENIYRMVGERFKHQYAGNQAWVLSSSPDLLKLISLRPSARIRLFNGSLECSFQKYELFEGKRRQLVLKRKGD